MSDALPSPQEATRITCHVHHRMSGRVIETVSALNIPTVFMESGRSVRLRMHSRPFGLPGNTTSLQDALADLLTFSVSRRDAPSVIQAIVDAGELYVPGRGTIFAQDIVEYRSSEILPLEVLDQVEIDQSEMGQSDMGQSDTHEKRSRLSRHQHRRLPINNLALLTCILSMPGSGEQLAQAALELGTCVPVITLGAGTGLRDLLGLLRITIPPEKDIVHLVVPAHDTKSIVRMLIETTKLNRPGRGIIYQTPARLGMIDTRLRIGPQEHAASIDQIIAAIDELKADTTWRTRFSPLDEAAIGVSPPLLANQFEITIVSHEDNAADLVSRALRAGAVGATTARVRRLVPAEANEGIAARERTVIVVGASVRDAVVRTLLEANFIGEDRTNRLQILSVPAAYTHIQR